MVISSPAIYIHVVEITFLAFYNKKPLFSNEQKPKAAELIKNCSPLINKAYANFCRAMNSDLRQNAQISRSGLQYLIDEFDDDQKVYKKLKPIFDAPGVKRLEEKIMHCTGIPPEHSVEEKMDLTKIPSSHFWWFFIDDDDEDE